MFGPTADHDEIHEWATRHNAHPAQMRPVIFDSEPAILHFIFGDVARDLEQMQPISWDAFFAQFTLMSLRLVYDETPEFELLQPDRNSKYRQQSADI